MLSQELCSHCHRKPELADILHDKYPRICCAELFEAYYSNFYSVDWAYSHVVVVSWKLTDWELSHLSTLSTKFRGHGDGIVETPIL